jgi:L-histidine Nalpha-methyltransferase
MTARLERIVATAASRAHASAIDTSLAQEIIRGLSSSPKTLPAKAFYDPMGALLFERICGLPEYYLTHAEIEILRARAAEIASLAGPRCALVEYGSGAGLKVRLLLNAMDHPIAYVPIDISGEQLDRVSTDMKAEYPHLSVLPLHADYTADVELPPLPSSSRTIGFFPGSTIGNFHPDEATEFLARIRRAAGDRGALLLGVDRVKPAETLNAAYNDSQGVTAAFNRNVLRRINRELGADFRLEDFEHRAWYNEPASRIEMHLVSRRRHTVTVAGTCIHFDRGESVWTESSYKYDFRRLQRLVTSAGFSLKRLWTDDASQFWVAFLETA